MDNESFNTMRDATAASVKTRMKKQKSMKSRIFSAIKKKRGSTKQINSSNINNNNNNSVLKTKKSDNSFLSSRQNASSVAVVGKKENASMIEGNNKSQVTSSVNNKYVSPTVIIVPQDDDDDAILVVVDDDHSKLQKVFPLATQEEIKRFLIAKNNQYDLAYEQLQKYFQWRNEYNLAGDELSSVVVDFDFDDDDDDDEVDMEDWHSCASSDETIDELDWKIASQKALAYTNTNKNKVVDQTINVDDDNTSSLSGNMNFILPQLVRVVTDNNNNGGDVRGTKRILHLLPAQLDSSMASDETYVLCIAYYLEQKLYRNSMEKLLIVLDLRGGYGWSNPTPYALLSFIKKLIQCMEQNFPERLAQCLVFPMPAIAYMFWNMIKKLQILDPNTTEKIILVPGNAAIGSPPPYGKIEKLGCISKDLIDRMERTRLSSFCEKH